MESNDIKSKTKLFSLCHIMIERSLHSINKTLHIMEVSKLQTVFQATQINKQPASGTVFEGSDKTFEENNYMMSENIAIPTRDGNRGRQFEQDTINMYTVFDQANVSLVSEPRSVFCEYELSTQR